MTLSRWPYDLNNPIPVKREQKQYAHFTLFRQRIRITIPENLGMVGDFHETLSYLRGIIGASLYMQIESGSIQCSTQIEAESISYPEFTKKLMPPLNDVSQVGEHDC